MRMKQFQDGYLLYECEKLSLDKLLQKYDFANWQNGFIAFSNTEWCYDDQIDIKAMLKGNEEGKVSGLSGIEGYLMEINLWRNHNTGWEEIVVERDDDGFYCQSWKLLKQKPQEENHFECRYRSASTFPRRNSIFKDQLLESIEVVVPQSGFYIFITSGANPS